MAEFKKSDAIDFAHNMKLLVDALVEEGFDREYALVLIEGIMTAGCGKSTNVKMF